MAASKDLTFNIFGRDVSASKTLDNVGKSVDRLNDRLNSFGAGSTKALAGLTLGALGAGAAIGGALGLVTAGFLGAGLGIAASSKQATAALRDLTQEVSDGAQSAAAPLSGPLTQSIVDLTGTARALQPQMREAFIAGIPALESLTRGTDQLARLAMPGLVTAVKSSQPAFRGLESLMVDTGYGAKEFFTNLSEGADSSETALANLGKILRDALGFAGKVLADLSNEGAPSVERLRQVLDQLFNVVSGLASSGFPVLFTAAGVALDVLSGVLGIIEPIASQMGSLIGVIVSVAAAFRLLSGISGVFAGITAGVQGLVKDVRAAGGETSGFASRMGALTSFAGGPFGIALGVASIAVAAFGSRQGEAARRTDDLTAALRTSKGALDDNVRSVAAKNLQDAGALDLARKAGVSLDLVTDAYLGQGEAADRLGSILSELARVHTVEASAEMDEVAYAAVQLTEMLGNMSPEAQKAVQDAKDLAAASSASSSAMANLTLAEKTNAASATELSGAYMTLQDNVGDANARLGALQTIMDKLTGRKPEYEEAVQALNDTFRDLAETYKSGSAEIGYFDDSLIKSDGTIDTTTEAGSRLQDTMVTLRDQTLAAADAMARNGATQQEVQQYIEGVRNRFIEQRKAAGWTQEGAEKLAGAYGLLPRDITTLFFTPNLGDRMQAVGALHAKIEALPDGHVIVYADTAGAQGNINRLISDNNGRVINVSVRANGDVWALGPNGQRVGLPARAMGGPVEAGKPYMVGEKGPELIFPSQDGFVATARETAAIMRGARTDSVRSVNPGSAVQKHFHLTVHASNAPVDVVRQFRLMEHMAGVM